MSRNAFPQIEREYAEELTRLEEHRAQIAEWRKQVALPDDDKSVQASAIAEQQSMQLRAHNR